VRDKYEFLSWFDPLVISGQVGYAKPDPEIYQILLFELGRKAADCLFIDDNVDNIQEAERQGFETILFTSSEQLRASLTKKVIL